MPRDAAPLIAVRDEQTESHALPDVPETGGSRVAAVLAPAAVAITWPTYSKTLVRIASLVNVSRLVSQVVMHPYISIHCLPAFGIMIVDSWRPG